MNRSTYELMLNEVRAIFHAVTNRELELHAATEHIPVDSATLVDWVTQRFAELDACVRLLPSLAERVPPFSFAPPIDVIEHEHEIVFEAALPGVARREVEVEVVGGHLVVSGLRALAPETKPNGFGYRHAEIPRGPFRRVLPLPPEVANAPMRVDELVDGVLRVHLSKRGTSRATA
jgi:HSP20 family molecular chaperone IbpA